MEINEKILLDFRNFLIEEEKSSDTISKYLSNIKEFCSWKEDKECTKQLLLDYKKYLLCKNLNPVTINAKLSSLNGLFKFLNHSEYCVKFLKIQQKVFRSEDKELSKRDYETLVNTAYAQNKEQLALILQTIGSTGIRISELKYITRDTVENGKVCIHLKGKERTILIPKTLKKKLLPFIKKNNITEQVFVTKNNTPISRHQVWKQMKTLCKKAHIDESKVFPHNLRHLFAITFYKINKDIAKLADILGHSSINTTRIYLISSGKEHLCLLDKMKLVC